MKNEWTPLQEVKQENSRIVGTYLFVKEEAWLCREKEKKILTTHSHEHYARAGSLNKYYNDCIVCESYAYQKFDIIVSTMIVHAFTI